MKKGKKLKAFVIISMSVVGIIILLAESCLWFLLDAYEADDKAIEAFADGGNISYTVIGNTTVFYPEEAEKGFIFYPGAKVEHEAYIPLMEALADNGIMCILVEMPLHFPLIDGDAAEEIVGDYPEIEEWYIGGHSLGGYAASLYLEESSKKYEGLILLASYSGADLTETDLSVLCMYGTEDSIMNADRYSEGLELLPAGYREVIIEGGCHAYFGVYDGQDGNLAKITNEEQINICTNAILELIGQ